MVFEELIIHFTFRFEIQLCARIVLYVDQVISLRYQIHYEV